MADPTSINELSNVREQSSGTELIVRIEQMRARHLSTEAKDALQHVLNTITAQVMDESFRLATSDPTTPYQPINKAHIAMSLNFVSGKWARRKNRRERMIRVIEAILVGALLGVVPLIVDHHLYTATVVACVVAVLGIAYAFWVRD